MITKPFSSATQSMDRDIKQQYKCVNTFFFKVTIFVKLLFSDGRSNKFSIFVCFDWPIKKDDFVEIATGVTCMRSRLNIGYRNAYTFFHASHFSATTIFIYSCYIYSLLSLFLSFFILIRFSSVETNNKHEKQNTLAKKYSLKSRESTTRLSENSHFILITLLRCCLCDFNQIRFQIGPSNQFQTALLHLRPHLRNFFGKWRNSIQSTLNWSSSELWWNNWIRMQFDQLALALFN